MDLFVILAIRLWIAWLDRTHIWLQAARAPFKAAEAKEVERFEAEMLAYNEPVRTTHARPLLFLDGCAASWPTGLCYFGPCIMRTV